MAERRKKKEWTEKDGKEQVKIISKTIDLDEETDRLQLKIFSGNWSGNWRSVEEEINAWLRGGGKKEIMRFDWGVCTVKSSFSSGGEEREIYCIFHYKFVSSYFVEEKKTWG